MSKPIQSTYNDSDIQVYARDGILYVAVNGEEVWETDKLRVMVKLCNQLEDAVHECEAA
ncbi:MAG: hypothetical protein QM729_21300 [Solirubrobacterales bacterium]